MKISCRHCSCINTHARIRLISSLSACHGRFAHGARIGGAMPLAPAPLLPDGSALFWSIPGRAVVGDGLVSLDPGTGLTIPVLPSSPGRAVALHGAVVATPDPPPGMPAAPLEWLLPVAQGAPVPARPPDGTVPPRADGPIMLVLPPIGAGWLDVCAEVGAGGALGSVSQLNKDPKGKCCTTGNLAKTSAAYILIMPCSFMSVISAGEIVKDYFS